MPDFEISTAVLVAVYLWVIPWKGVALWKASKNGQKGWFIVILILNTLAILDIIYIFLFSNTKRQERPSQSIIRS